MASLAIPSRHGSLGETGPRGAETQSDGMLIASPVDTSPLGTRTCRVTETEVEGGKPEFPTGQLGGVGGRPLLFLPRGPET